MICMLSELNINLNYNARKSRIQFGSFFVVEKWWRMVKIGSVSKTKLMLIPSIKNRMKRKKLHKKLDFRKKIL